MAFEFGTQIEPIEITTVANAPATFSVIVTSNEPEVASFLYQWQKYNENTFEFENIPNATLSSYSIDHALYLNPAYDFVDEVFVDTDIFQTLISGMSAGEFQGVIVSHAIELRVIEDVPPFDVLDVYPETGRERQRRLRTLGYI